MPNNISLSLSQGLISSSRGEGGEGGGGGGGGRGSGNGTDKVSEVKAIMLIVWSLFCFIIKINYSLQQ